MRNKALIIIALCSLVMTLVFLPAGNASAATFADGTYSVPFELKEAGNNNTSIADGYFSKPATLVVKNGVNYIQLTTTESEWVKSISGPNGGSTVINESGNTRTVQLQVGDLSNPVNLKMHVVVPEDVAGMKYDHHHTVRAVFDVSGVSTATSGSSDTADQSGTGDAVENPQTGDTSSIGLYVVLLVSSIAVLAFYRLRLARN